MRIGAANKKQLIIMAALLAVLAAVVIYDYAGFGTSSAAPPARTSAERNTTTALQNDLDPTVHLATLEASRRVKYEPGRNIFEMEAAPMPTPITTVRQLGPPPGPPTPTPTPPPPPIPLKFYGFANKPGEAKRIFLAEGDPQNSTVFIARQGDIVDRRYRVTQIAATSVEIEDVLYNHKQRIPLTAR
ncbi:MAG TPA: hypothetical protein VFP59_15405 [Candidatus Angelobacter sp.]|nr:hypothetical protein [Candidatus Angelobacter sp.]